MNRSLHYAAMAVTVFSLSGPVHASDSLGFDVSGGVGTSGFDMNGALDVNVHDFKNPLETSLSFAHQHTTVGTESTTNEVVAGVSNEVTDNWETNASLTFWKDTINDVHYVGPTFGMAYTWNKEGADQASSLSEKDETETAPASKDEVAALSVNADLFFYGTEVIASSTTRTVFNPRSHRLVTQVVGPRSGTESVTQFHPNVTFEKPVLEGQATPYMTVGHYFYSKDPSSIEALTGRPRFASSVNQINGLVGGFLNNNGELGVRVALPWQVDSDVRIGAAQLETDNSWSTTQGITLSRPVIHHLRAKVDWSRSIENGASSDLFTGGFTWLF